MVSGFVLFDGLVYSSFKPLVRAEAMVVVGDRVVYVGGESRALKIADALGLEEVDLKGRVVMPGFIDAHAHLDSIGINLATLDLRGVGSIEELKSRLREYVKNVKTEWIIGRGWDQELFRERRWPSKFDIDDVVNDRPVMLVRVCGHAAVLNTRAMELTGLLNAADRDVVRDEVGNATGVIVERALDRVEELVKDSYTLDDFREFMINAMRYAASLGVTTVGFVSVDLRSLQSLIMLERGLGRLPIRVRAYLNPSDHGIDVIELLRQLGIRAGFGSQYLRINGIKVIADGSLGARTAWLSRPYNDDPGNSGRPNYSFDELMSIARRSAESGLQLAIHGIGDKMVETILDIYNRLGNAQVLRHRIEHASVLREDLIKRVKELGIALAVQPHFVITDWWVVSRIGADRARYVYPFKTLINNGVMLGFSTDAPVEPLNPWETVYAAVTRGCHEGIELCRYTENEKVSVADALHHYTYGSAYLLREEDELGKLEPGYLADFIIIDKDPLNIDEKELRNIKILETYTGGQRIYP
ncbi:amidohydrolase [Vulcanisaeta distributa]|uniref:Amidohydrolase 3 n=1 Tax=Vulcanisaeta distributa (strain DSM 14429 / JCM 11212 / NBRC 100878 / IC-017) TaxID=572478 RepID=E1QUQ3_VULDI|nr:amidohydrolase [Vulcanisaeta distributa]ADN51172.1 Amidohydrolase 3 [Vulcanisaeta distributa DSM 14429]